MKKLILFLLLISFISLYSQDKEPSQLKFWLNTDSTYLSGDSNYFKQSSFILGWAWSCAPKMTKAMLDNQAHVSTGYPKNIVADSTLLIINSSDVWTMGSDFVPTNSQSLVYSPVLRIINPESQTNIRQNDPRHYIFGFRFFS